MKAKIIFWNFMLSFSGLCIDTENSEKLWVAVFFAWFAASALLLMLFRKEVAGWLDGK